MHWGLAEADWSSQLLTLIQSAANDGEQRFGYFWEENNAFFPPKYSKRRGAAFRVLGAAAGTALPVGFP